MFLYISKTFDKVWYEGLIYKQKQNGMSGKLLNIIKYFLDSRKQRVVLNGQYSSWVCITIVVPQGSILGSLFFAIYIKLRYFNFEPSFKLRWYRARDLLGSQIPVTTGGFELRISCTRSSYLTH